MKHQYEDYIEFVEEMIADTGDDRSFYFNTAFRASLLANKATLEKKPMNYYPDNNEDVQYQRGYNQALKDLQIAVINHLDEVMR
jgi:hypothetical protein